MSKHNQSSIIKINELKIFKFISLANYTTWRTGGVAEWFAEPKSINEIQILLSWALENKLACTIIGAGSNLLINDNGLKGLTICLRKLLGYKIDENNGLIEASSGENIPSLARKAAKSGLSGLEWAVGIPGTIGGASVMNAGAQGGSISELLESVKVIPLYGGNSFNITNKDLIYSYRNSRLQEEKLLVLSARFQLEPGNDVKKLLQVTNSNLSKRTSTQPYQLPSCGSVFRNPGPHKAGKLIEEAGLKGFCIGGAEVSTVHANFIVNKGHASSEDINDVIKYVQKKILERYGIKLHPEVKKLGFNSRI